MPTNCRDNTLIWDDPQGTGAQNVIKRAHRLLDLHWTPTAPMRINEKKYWSIGGDDFTPTEVVGTPYASTRVSDKFIGIDLPVETYLSAVNNPASILYRRDLGDFNDPAYCCTVKNAFILYGVVCSVFVSYCLDMTLRRTTYEWDTAPELEPVTSPGPDSLRVCDTLVTTDSTGHAGGHVRIVTGLGRDADGKVQSVEISESIPPVTVCRCFTRDEFTDSLLGHTGTYRIFRYRYLDRVRDVQSIDVTCDPRAPQPHYGDGAAYRTDETVEISLPVDALELVIASDAGEQRIKASDLPVRTFWKTERRIWKGSLPVGEYTASCIYADGTSEASHFTVAALPEVEYLNEDGSKLGTVVCKLCRLDGTELTEDAPELYEDGKLLSAAVIAVKCEGAVYPIHVGIARADSGIFVRPSALFTDADGNILKAIRIGGDTELYALAAKKGAPLIIRFTSGELCRPLYISWRDETFATYNQRVLTECELASGEARSLLILSASEAKLIMKTHESDFVHLALCCRTDTCRLVTPSVLMLAR